MFGRLRRYDVRVVDFSFVRVVDRDHDGDLTVGRDVQELLVNGVFAFTIGPAL
jgi:hypothetical protein